MTFDEALELLGLTESSSAKQARRAYLALVKRHKPEGDPEGFQRVREAYELAKEGLEWRERFAPAPDQRAASPPLRAPAPAAPEVPEAEPGTAALAPQARAPLVSTSDAASAPTVEQVEQPVDATGAPESESATEPDLQEYYDEESELDADQADQAVRLWQRAVERYPESAQAHWSLVEAHEWAGDARGVSTTLAQAYQRGLSGFAVALLTRAPERAPAELLERAASDCELSLAAASGFTDQREPGRALPYLRAALGRHLERGDVPLADAGVVVQTIAQLLAQQGLAESRELGRLWQQALKQDADHRHFGGASAARWLVLRELLEVGDELPKPVVKTLAEGIAGEGADEVSVELGRYASKNPGRARGARDTLKASAPALFAAYGRLLESKQESRWMQQNGLFFGVVFILLQIGRCALRDDDDSARASLEQARESAAKVATVRASPRSSLPAVNGDVDRELVVRASARIAALASDLGLSQLEQSVAGVERGFAEGCEALTPRFAELVAQSRDQDAELTTQVQYLWGEFLVACPDYAQAVRP